MIRLCFCAVPSRLCASPSRVSVRFLATNHPFRNAYGIKYSVSPQTALEKFHQWADDQGLNRFLLNRSNLGISASYVPHWSFSLNARFVKDKSYQWKPELLKIYGNQSVVHLAGLSAYAGYSFRRSLMDNLHSTTLVFLGDQLTPFNSYMLKDMRLSNGERLEIFPDPWNATKGRAYSIVKDSLEALAAAEDADVRVQTEVLSSRRVYLPVYIIDYKVLGMEYKAYISGCDEAAAVSGISHKIFDISNQDISEASNAASSFMNTGLSVASRLGGRNLGTLIVVGLQFFGSLLARILTRIPVIGVLGGAFIGFRKIVRPWMDNRAASAEWERQREHEAAMRDVFEHIDDFVDSGSARRYFEANRSRILRHLAGENEHSQGDFGWYNNWEKWARQQWEQQQQYQQQQSGQYRQQQQQSYGGQQASQRQRASSRKKTEFQWDFDPNNP